MGQGSHGGVGIVDAGRIAFVLRTARLKEVGMRVTAIAILCVGLLIFIGCPGRNNRPQPEKPAQTAAPSELLEPVVKGPEPIPFAPRRASVIGVVEVNRPTAWWKVYIGERPQLSPVAEERGLPNWVFPDVDWYEASVNEACEVVRSVRKADLWVYDLEARRSKVAVHPMTGRVLLETEITSPEAYQLRIGEDGVPVLLTTNSRVVESMAVGELARERLRCLEGLVVEAKEDRPPQSGTGTEREQKDIDEIYVLLSQELRQLAEERARLEEERKALQGERRAFAEGRQRLTGVWESNAQGEEWIVQASKLNVRATPQLYGEILAVLSKGLPVRVLGREGPWAQIVFRPKGDREGGVSEGWVTSKFLRRLGGASGGVARGSAGEEELLLSQGGEASSAGSHIPGEMEVRIEPTKVDEWALAGEPEEEGAEQGHTASVVADEQSEELRKQEVRSEPQVGVEVDRAPPSPGTNGWHLTAGESYPFVVHVATFASAQDAEEAVEKWQTDGHMTYPVLFRTSDGQNWFRVYLGRFATREQAEVTSVQLRHEGKISYSLPLRAPFALLTGSFARQEDAEEKRIILRVKGLLPYVVPFATVDGTEYRVYIGAYPSVEQAEEEARFLRENHTAYTVARF